MAIFGESLPFFGIYDCETPIFGMYESKLLFLLLLPPPSLSSFFDLGRLGVSSWYFVLLYPLSLLLLLLSIIIYTITATNTTRNTSYWIKYWSGKQRRRRRQRKRINYNQTHPLIYYVIYWYLRGIIGQRRRIRSNFSVYYCYYDWQISCYYLPWQRPTLLLQIP